MDQVDEIKQKVDIVSLLGEFIGVKKAGKNYKALCPFHGEKTPSFMISPELQIYKCFGCGETGDVFTFLQKYEGMEFREALKFLADRVGVKLVSYRPGEETEKERLIQLNELTKRFYNYILLNHKAGKVALDYLVRQRRLIPDTIETFQIGFSPDVPDVLRKFLVEKKKFNIKELEKAGLGFFKGRDFIDKFRGRVIFPLLDHRGNTVGFAGRILPTNTNQELAKYINSPETPIYHKSRLLFGLSLTKDAIKKAGEAVLVEGELDMISSWQSGIKNVIAIKGSALTEDQVKLLSRFSRKMVLALDSDFAGDKAARAGIVVAQKEGLEIRVARLGDYKDPDEMAQKDPEGYKKALGEAIGVWDFIIDSVFNRFKSESGEDKAKISREIIPILATIPDKIVQAHYVKIVADLLEVPIEAVTEQISDFISQKGEEEERNKVENIKVPQKARRQLLEERFLTLAFQYDPKMLSDKKVGSLIETPLAKRILEEYKIFTKTHTEFSPSGFSENLPKELVNGFAEMVLADTEEFIEDPDDFSKELDLVVRELEIVDIRHKLEVLGAKIREYESANERKNLQSAQGHFRELTAKLSVLEEQGEGGIILQEA